MKFAVVPAAGLSTRMGRPKLLLPLGGRPVLDHIVAALRGGGVEHVLVVIGPHVPELAAVAEAASAHVHFLAQATPDMRTTVEHGLRWLEERFHPRPDDAWFLAPGDHAAVDAQVVRLLCEAYAVEPRRSIFVPVHDGRRGHPTLIAWRHVAGIRSFSTGQGLNGYLRSRAEDVMEIPVQDASVLVNLDTPEDYERLRATWPGKTSTRPKTR
jgi:CTP:molybdopterin cytidylyltransferase MocA